MPPISHFRKKDLTAIEADLNDLSNLTNRHSEHLDFIRDNVQNKSLHIVHGATGIVVVVVVMVVVIGIAVIRRKTDLLQQMLPITCFHIHKEHNMKTEGSSQKLNNESGPVYAGT